MFPSTSESSMFVSKNRFILKTCGTTTLLRAIEPLMQLVLDAYPGTVVMVSCHTSCVSSLSTVCVCVCVCVCVLYVVRVCVCICRVCICSLCMQCVCVFWRLLSNPNFEIEVEWVEVIMEWL